MVAETAHTKAQGRGVTGREEDGKIKEEIRPEIREGLQWQAVEFGFTW